MEMMTKVPTESELAEHRLDIESEAPAMSRRQLRLELLYLDREDPYAVAAAEVYVRELRARRRAANRAASDG